MYRVYIQSRIAASLSFLFLFFAACSGPEESGTGRTEAESPAVEEGKEEKDFGSAQTQPPDPRPGTEILGTVVGIGAKVPFEELTEGEDIKNMAFNGILAVELSDGARVRAVCAEKLISDVTGSPSFNKSPDQIGGGFAANITIGVDAGQQVRLVADESRQWQVAKVLK